MLQSKNSLQYSALYIEKKEKNIFNKEDASLKKRNFRQPRNKGHSK